MNNKIDRNNAFKAKYHSQQFKKLGNDYLAKLQGKKLEVKPILATE